MNTTLSATGSGVIKQAGEKSAALTRHLLAFSRRQILKPEVVDLSAIVKDICVMLPRLLTEEIMLEVSTPNETVPVKDDRGQLEQSILNLALNAKDAMPRGGQLTISVERTEMAGSRYPTDIDCPCGMVSLTDNGSGIDLFLPPHISVGRDTVLRELNDPACCALALDLRLDWDRLPSRGVRL